MDVNKVKKSPFREGDLRGQWKEAIINRLRSMNFASASQVKLLIDSSRRNYQVDQGEGRDFICEMVARLCPGKSARPMADLIVRIVEKYFPESEEKRTNFADALLSYGVYHAEGMDYRDGELLGCVADALLGHSDPIRDADSFSSFIFIVTKHVFKGRLLERSKEVAPFVAQAARAIFPGDKPEQKKLANAFAFKASDYLDVAAFKQLAHELIDNG